jgi:hypothetical protein
MAKQQRSGDTGPGSMGRGTPAKKRTKSPAAAPGARSVKGGPTKGAGRGKHAATRSQGVRTRATRKAGPKKTARKTTTRSGDK